MHKQATLHNFFKQEKISKLIHEAEKKPHRPLIYLCKCTKETGARHNCANIKKKNANSLGKKGQLLKSQSKQTRCGLELDELKKQ